MYATPCGSLPPTITITTDPCGVEGRRGDVGFPGSSGLRPSDTRAMNNRPLPGSSPYRTSRTALGVVLLSLLSSPSSALPLSPPSAISQLSLLSPPQPCLSQPCLLSPPSLSPASLSPPSSALPPQLSLLSSPSSALSLPALPPQHSLLSPPSSALPPQFSLPQPSLSPPCCAPPGLCISATPV